MSTPLPRLASAADVARVAAARRQEHARQAQIARLKEQIATLTARVKSLERTIRVLLFSDALPGAQRDELVALLAGLRPIDGQPTAALCASEKELIAAYRRLNATGRRHLVGLVHAAGKTGGGR
jgi:hypothetical protein